GGKRGMLHPVLQLVFERSVALVDVEVVPFEKIVRYIDIGPAVAVDVPYRDAETQADGAAVDTRLAGDLGEMAVVVAEQVVPSAGSCLQRNVFHLPLID